MSLGVSGMAELTAPLQTKSAKIRALAKAGVSRAEIARYLNIRYQHVRNVLTQAPPRSEVEASSSEPGQKGNLGEWPVETLRDDVVADADGTLRINGELLRAAEISPGDSVLVRVVDGEIRLSGYAASLRRAQWIAKRFHQPGRSEVDDFIAERRALGARGD